MVWLEAQLATISLHLLCQKSSQEGVVQIQSLRKCHLWVVCKTLYPTIFASISTSLLHFFQMHSDSGTSPILMRQKRLLMKTFPEYLCSVWFEESYMMWKVLSPFFNIIFFWFVHRYGWNDVNAKCPNASDNYAQYDVESTASNGIFPAWSFCQSYGFSGTGKNI